MSGLGIYDSTFGRDEALRFVMVMSLLGAVGYAYLSVQLVAKDGLLTLINYVRIIEIPFAEIVAVDAENGLRVISSTGTVTSAVSAPSLAGALAGYPRAGKVKKALDEALHAAPHRSPATTTTRLRPIVKGGFLTWPATYAVLTTFLLHTR